MTRLRRAPREVYRVYSEDEFFACAADENPTESATGVERRRRVVGVASLLAAIAAAGGLIAIAAPTPAMRSGGKAPGPLAATGSPTASRLQSARVWSQSAAGAGLRRLDTSIGRTTLANPRRSARGFTSLAGRLQELLTRKRVAPSFVSLAAGPRVMSAPVSVVAAVGPTSWSHTSPPRPRAAEFGFER